MFVRLFGENVIFRWRDRGTVRTCRNISRSRQNSQSGASATPQGSMVGEAARRSQGSPAFARSRVPARNKSVINRVH